MRRERPERADASAVEDARAEARARRLAALHLAHTRSHRTSRSTASDVLWDAALMAARQTALALPGDPGEAAIHARAFRVLDESWWRLVDRHERDRAAQAESHAENGPPVPSRGAAGPTSAGPRGRVRGGLGGVDGP